MKVAVSILVFCVAALLVLGVVMLYSSTMTQNGLHQLVWQLLWCGLGLVVCAVAALMDYRWLKGAWWLLLGVAVVMLGLVLAPGIGTLRGGARRWFIFDFAGVSFQPSEFAKLALLIALAWYGELCRRQMGTCLRGIIIPGLAIGLVVGLIFREPDVGSALVLAAVSGAVLLIAGTQLKYLLPPVLIGLVAVGLFIYYNPVRSGRIYAWLHVEETKQDKGRQAYQAMVALGSGGLTGRGLGDSRQKLGYLPAHQTDFIFAIIGEELGLVGTGLVVLAFVAVFGCGLYIAWHASDSFGLLLGSGICFLIAFQAAVNIGVVTSALPNKGLPLPFISRGGSNLLVLLAGVGLLLSIARQGRTGEALEDLPDAEEEFQEPNPLGPRPLRSRRLGLRSSDFGFRTSHPAPRAFRL
ncbi:MAG: putative peptidoglycan glycosyltransferase FtsW [Verrucomicrobiota bacterium]|jgi:cell division protein FtsW